MYNYKEAVREDVKEYLEDNQERIHDLLTEEGIEDAKQYLLNDLYRADSVTGNASGSYFCNAWKAEEALSHNLDLLQEAAEEFGDDLGELVKRGPEVCDCVIRCHLLYYVFDATFDEVFGD